MSDSENARISIETMDTPQEEAEPVPTTAKDKRKPRQPKEPKPPKEGKKIMKLSCL